MSKHETHGCCELVCVAQDDSSAPELLLHGCALWPHLVMQWGDELITLLTLGRNWPGLKVPHDSDRNPAQNLLKHTLKS